MPWHEGAHVHAGSLAALERTRGLRDDAIFRKNNESRSYELHVLDRLVSVKQVDEVDDQDDDYH
jgi:hypothetical protein